MSTEAQRKGSELTGEALKAARDEVPEYLLERLAKVADGDDRLRTATDGEIAGAWMANPAATRATSSSPPVYFCWPILSTATSCSTPCGPGTSAARGRCRANDPSG